MYFGWCYLVVGWVGVCFVFCVDEGVVFDVGDVVGVGIGEVVVWV